MQVATISSPKPTPQAPAQAAPGKPPAAPKAAPATKAAPSALGVDELSLGLLSISAKPTEEELRHYILGVSKLIGKPLELKDEKALKAYIESMLRGMEPGEYDKDGFLKSLRLAPTASSGRTNDGIWHSVKATDFKPDNKLWGIPIYPQLFFFWLGKTAPGVFHAVSKVTDPLMQLPSTIKGKYKKPFTPAQKAIPTGQTPEQRYAGILMQPKSVTRIGIKFGNDFHSGVPPKGVTEPTQGYGTYNISRLVGFTDEQARRIAVMGYGVDENITPYGKTSPSPLDQMDRHFNFNREGQDTRLLWAKRHLEAAVEYAKQQAYDQAEIELGCGLHSLQDLFAHGQATPSTHATTGHFPDEVTTNPLATYEATLATEAYLRTYLFRIQDAKSPGIG